MNNNIHQSVSSARSLYPLAPRRLGYRERRRKQLHRRPSPWQMSWQGGMRWLDLFLYRWNGWVWRHHLGFAFNH